MTLRSIAALAFVVLSSTAQAQTYPNKPIRVLVPFPPGGGTDIIAREITQKVGAANGWTFVIDNRPGAGGNLGIDGVAKAPADGYTIGLGQTSNLAINPTLYTRMPYDPVKDLTPILLVADAPLVMVTSGTSAFKSLGDAVKAAQARPGSVNFASPGNGTVAHLASELLQNAARFKIQHVPYKGAAQAMTDVVSGTVELYMSSVPTLLGQIKQGKLRALAVTSKSRVASLPQTPTVAESGFKDFEAVTWFGFVAPAGTPAQVVSKLNTEFNKALKQVDLQKKLEEQGAHATGGSADQFAKLIKDDIVRWGLVVKQSGARID